MIKVGGRRPAIRRRLHPFHQCARCVESIGPAGWRRWCVRPAVGSGHGDVIAARAFVGLGRMLPILLLWLLSAPVRAAMQPAVAGAPVHIGNAPSPDSLRVLEVGARYTAWFVEGPVDSLAQAVLPETRTRIGGVEGLRKSHAGLRQHLGVRVTVLHQRTTRDGEGWRYEQWARFDKATPGQVHIQ